MSYINGIYNHGWTISEWHSDHIVNMSKECKHNPVWDKIKEHIWFKSSLPE